MNQFLPLAVALLSAIVAIDQAWSGPTRNVPVMVIAIVVFVMALAIFYRRRYDDSQS